LEFRLEKIAANIRYYEGGGGFILKNLKTKHAFDWFLGDVYSHFQVLFNVVVLIFLPT